MEFSLSLTGDQYKMLRAHLLAADGQEAAAVALCGRRQGHDRQRLVVQKLWLIPYSACEQRSGTGITWETDLIVDLLEEARVNKLSVVKFHSHPYGPSAFSSQDDRSDGELFPSIDSWVETSLPHASVIMLGDGRLFGRVYTPAGFLPIGE